MQIIGEDMLMEVVYATGFIQVMQFVMVSFAWKFPPLFKIRCKNSSDWICTSYKGGGGGEMKRELSFIL